MDRFNPIDHPLAHASPRLLTGVSSWIEHIPFAFALIEMCRPETLVELGVYAGDSYCAFCQAIARLHLPTKCTGIDTWTGDEHSGPLSESALARLKSHHDPLYAGFSTLLQATFDQALQHVPDGSVDLLHIDGFHTYEAVQHDYQTWFPKLSKRAVVIMHDTAERDLGFGVWKLWDEISPKYPNLNFQHGHGLGVLAVGSEAPPALLRFLQLAKSDPAIAGYFAHLGLIVVRGRNLRLAGLYVNQMRALLDQRSQLLKQQYTPMQPDEIWDNTAETMERFLSQFKDLVNADLARHGASLPADSSGG